MQAGCNVSELVARWDEDGSDDIDQVEMIQGLRALRIEATNAELGALFDSVIALGPDVSGGAHDARDHANSPPTGLTREQMRRAIKHMQDMSVAYTARVAELSTNTMALRTEAELE